MTGVPWLEEDGPDEWRIPRVDRCEAGLCGHPNCWQDEGEALQRARDRADAYDARVHSYRDEP